MTALFSPPTRVRTLRAVVPRRGAPDAAAALARRLGQLDLSPPGLPASAILVLRKLADPDPGQLRCRDADPRPPARWAAALNAQLAAALRDAARPAHAPVPADAPAVLFLDPAEMLGCLAADWLRRELSQRWWWNCLFPATPARDAAVRAWLEQPTAVPAALAWLARRQLAVPFVAHLGAEHCERLLRSLAPAFDLPLALWPGRPATDEPGSHRASAAGRSPASDRNPAPGPADAASASSASPWRALAPEAEHPALAPEQALLLGFALTLRRAPQTLHTAAFATALARWLQTTPLSPAALDSEEIRSPLSPRPALKPAPPPPTESTPRPPQEIAPRGSWPAPPPEPPTERAPAWPAPPGSVAAPAEAPPPPAAGPSLAVTGPAQATNPSDADRPVTAAAEAALLTLESGSPHSTACGGVFYLVNLALHLQLYGDFSRPRAVSLALSLWDFLALAGAELIGCAWTHDALPPLLATLAGRAPSQAPGSLADPPRVATLPPGIPEALRQAAAGLEDCPPDIAWARWMTRALPSLRARLDAALGLAKPAALPEVLFRRSARVRVRPSHLDVHFHLADVSLAVRRAGLDRDPGWVPAAACAIAFHYD